MEENQASFKGWARVEVMGHQTHIGYVETQAFGGSVLFRVDQPEIEGCEETLSRPEWIDNKYAQPGSIVKREAIPAATVLVGASSIYRIIPCDESAALKAIRSSIHRPLIAVKLVEVPGITAGSVADEQDSNEDRDDYMPGGF